MPKKSLVFLAATAIAGCAVGEEPGFGNPVQRWPVGNEDEAEQEPESAVPGAEAFAWSADADSGTSHRLLAAGEDAIVLAASRQRVAVSRYASDGALTWSIELPQIFGGAPVEIGSARDGQIVVAGSPSDGGEELVLVSLSKHGEARGSSELVGDWGPVQARGVAVHRSGAVAVLAEEFVDGRVARTHVEFLDRNGLRQARESFSQSRAALAIVADDEGFAAFGDAGANEQYPHNTWIRGYTTDGVLGGANVLGMAFTGAWVRELDYGAGEEVWVGGIVDATLSCLLPALRNPSDYDMKESPVDEPLAMTHDRIVIAIEDGVLKFFPNAGDPTMFVPAIGTARLVAAGAQANDPIFALSHDDATNTTQLHRLE